MTHLISFIKKESNSESTKEYKLDDLDHPNGWNWKEVDMLYGMGFEPEGDSRMILKVKNQDKPEQLTFKIYKTDENYVLVINDTKHFFKSFSNMLNKIDELGSVEI